MNNKNTGKYFLLLLSLLFFYSCCKNGCDNETTTTTTSPDAPVPYIAAFSANPLTGSIPFRVHASCEAQAADSGSLTYTYSTICMRDGKVVESKMLYNGSEPDISLVVDVEADCQLAVEVCESGIGCAEDELHIKALDDDLNGSYFEPGADINEKIYAVIGYPWSEFGLKAASSVTIDYSGITETKVIAPPKFSIGFPEGFVIAYTKKTSVQDWFILKTDGDIIVESYEGSPPDEIDSYYYKVIEW